MNPESDESTKESKFTIEVESLTSWNNLKNQNEDEKISNTHQISKFPVHNVINSKLFLYKGDICKMDVDAIVNPSNDFLKDTKGISGRIVKAAGSNLITEYRKNDGCKTGEAKITKGYSLVSRNVIHTIGPRYHEKFRYAAENALHSCYRSVMQLLVENQLSSIAIPPLYSEDKGFLKEHGAHIGIRTIRRFLEHFGEAITSVVLVVESDAEFEIYNRLLALYFPRSKSEQTRAISLLPEDTGNEFGETVIEERKIRISAFPGMEDSSEDDEEEEEEVKAVATKDLTRMTLSPDEAKSNVFSSSENDEDREETERAYYAFLYKARNTNLDDIAKMNFIYQAGRDNFGRTVIAIIGKNLPESEIVLDRVLMYMIRLLDPLIDNKFCLVYFHSDMSSRNTPQMAWLRQLHDIFDTKFSRNLFGFYVVHPTFWLKMFLTFTSPFLSKTFKEKLVYVNSLKDLFKFLNKEQLKLSQDIFSFDQRETGTKWNETSPIPHNDL